jgi:hypothetical protein
VFVSSFSRPASSGGYAVRQTTFRKDRAPTKS